MSPTGQLRGWKAIADYMGVTVRTAQRWETTLALPVVRGTLGVSADPAALDKWLRSTTTVGRDLAAADAGLQADAGAVAPGAQAAPRADAVSAAPARRIAPGLVLACAGISALVSFAVTRLAVLPLPAVRPIVLPNTPASNIVGDRRGYLVGRIAVDESGNGDWDAGERFVAEPGRDCPGGRQVAGFVIRWTGPAGSGSTAVIGCNPEPFFRGRLMPGRYTARLEVPAGWRSTSAHTLLVDIEPGRDTNVWFAVAPAP
ncbi:MAG TPA: hypothetical protein VF198_04380 [Vicinamibacterales bacterium]